MPYYSFLDLAYDALKGADKPLTYQEIWQLALEKGVTSKLKTSGKTPWQSLGAQLYVEVRDDETSRFIKVGKNPARFFLKEMQSQLPANVLESIRKEESKAPSKTADYNERDLHPLLTYFAYSNPSFNRGRSILSKTIFHEKSLKSGYNEWVHPDLVGFYLPLEDWRPEVFEFNKLSDNNSVRLFSFEVKKFLTKANYREAYFQAVSNSSWAHEGYLVAVQILQDDEFLSELERLTTSFGIGIIQLDPQDIDASAVVFPAHSHQTLDWDTINKLCEQNRDFQKFLQDVKIDFESKRIHRSEYDDVLKDINQYIRTKLKVGKTAT